MYIVTQLLLQLEWNIKIVKIKNNEITKLFLC